MLFAKEKNMTKVQAPFQDLSRFERKLYIASLLTVSGAFLLSRSDDVLTLIASLIGATALIFVAKGYVIGQVLTVVFSVFYGVISFYFHYYGEMITYLGMTSPIAVLAVISWLRHPYEETAEVEVNRMTKRQVIIMFALAAVVTVIFYFILRALGNANLVFSTISVTTSFLASYMTLYRSPYYAVGYAANDIVLIILWVLASMENSSYFPMVACFTIFFINDSYGFFNWQRMKKRQRRDENQKKIQKDQTGLNAD